MRARSRVVAGVSGLSLLAGFAVADLTGIRVLGGAVLAAGLAWAATRQRREGGTSAAAGVVAIGLAAFVLAHVLSVGLGWPAYPTVVGLSVVDAVLVARLGARRLA